MYDKKISIIIVNDNACYFIEQCLTSVYAAIDYMDVEIFVVDNNSTDDSVELLRSQFPKAVFIENKDNPGFPEANNQVIRQCTGEFILLLNPGTVIGEETIRTLCFFMDEHPNAGAVGVKMLDGHGNYLPESKRSFPSPWVLFCKIFGLNRLLPKSKLFARYSLLYLNPDKQHKVDVLSSTFMLLRHEALDKTGLLDESFHMYGEDIDLSYRMTLNGYKNYYLPERILYYKGEDRKYMNALYDAMLNFHKKYYPRYSWLIHLFIRLAIGFKALRGGQKKKTDSNRNNKHTRLLILCCEENFDMIKNVCLANYPQLEFVNNWNLSKERVMDAICRKNQMKRFTDIAFFYPDMRFEQILLFMDIMPNKKTNYHIYSKSSGRIVTSEEK